MLGKDFKVVKSKHLQATFQIHVGDKNKILIEVIKVIGMKESQIIYQGVTNSDGFLKWK